MEFHDKYVKIDTEAIAQSVMSLSTNKSNDELLNYLYSLKDEINKQIRNAKKDA